MSFNLAQLNSFYDVIVTTDISSSCRQWEFRHRMRDPTRQDSLYMSCYSPCAFGGRVNRVCGFSPRTGQLFVILIGAAGVDAWFVLGRTRLPGVSSSFVKSNCLLANRWSPINVASSDNRVRELFRLRQMAMTAMITPMLSVLFSMHCFTSSFTTPTITSSGAKWSGALTDRGKQHQVA